MMNEGTNWLFLIFLFSILVLLIVVLLRLPRGEKANELREELRGLREEASRAAKDSREELSKILKDANETLVSTLTNMAAVQRAQLDGMTDQIQKFAQSHYNSFSHLRDEVHGRIQDLLVSHDQKSDHMRRTLDEKMAAHQEQLSQGLKAANETLATTLTTIGNFQTTQLETVTTQCTAIRVSNESALDRIRSSLKKIIGACRRPPTAQIRRKPKRPSTISFVRFVEKHKRFVRGISIHQRLRISQ
jgi:F0F1-type ATP synthase membrane subunit b/b'